jgi:hypothetical protein
MKDEISGPDGSDGPGSPDDGRIDALVRAAAAARGASLDWHPDPAQLADYCLDALPPEEQERVREHLPLCAACAQLVLDLKAIAAAPAADGAPEEPAPDLDAAWRRMAARLELGEEGRATRRPPAPASRSGAWALAASLLLSVGLLAWGLGLRRDLESARQPNADLAMIDLTPLGENLERSAEAPRQVPAAAGIRNLLLQLDLGNPRSFPHYDMRLLAPGGKVVWRAPGVRRSEQGFFLLEIPREALSVQGLYRVEIEGWPEAAPTPTPPSPTAPTSPTSPTLLAAYTFVVPASTPSPGTR